ncbi:hypothetical protein LINGRAPRIM_LOCUS142 [Linum grandiflorum]
MDRFFLLLGERQLGEC